MSGDSFWQGVTESLAGSVQVNPASAEAVAGGSINRAWKVNSNTGNLFVKQNAADLYDMFAAEAAGLEQLQQCGAIRVPAVIGLGRVADCSFLALEYLPLQRGDTRAAQLMGRALAKMHGCRAEQFGWHRDNTIGSTPQINTQCSDWAEFFCEHRLRYQFGLAAGKGATRLASAGNRLLAVVDKFFEGHETAPCLLHGDLWGGNWAAINNEPVVFDPAVYFGDPETDVAMTTLFGGFPEEFYAAYRESRPDQPGAEQRRELYRLYHLLNHFNLFGGHYADQATAVIVGLLR